MKDEKRWILVSPNIDDDFQLLLTLAKTEEQKKLVGKQNEGKVFLFLHVEDLHEYYQHLKQNNVNIIKEPQILPHGQVFIFKDLYGNLWDVIQKN